MSWGYIIPLLNQGAPDLRRPQLGFPPESSPEGDGETHEHERAGEEEHDAGSVDEPEDDGDVGAVPCAAGAVTEEGVFLGVEDLGRT